MSKSSRVKRHVQTSIVARVIYRLFCLILICAGLFGLFLTYGANDMRMAYHRRNSTTEAVVTKLNTRLDSYGFQSCAVEYQFKIGNQRYTQESGWHNETYNNFNCHVSVNRKINIRYEKDNPHNNAFGDNEQDESLLTTAVIVIVILSIIPLGAGFIGLIAIHKALRAEDELEESERKRVYRRQAKISATESRTGND